MPRMLARAGIVVALLAAPALAFAAFDTVSMDTTVVLNIGGIEVDVSGSTAVIESIAVDTSSFTFTIQAGSVIQMTAPDRNILASDTSADRVTNTCTSSESVLKYTGGTVARTVTVTPSTSLCAGGSSSGGHSSGGSSATPATPAVPAVVPAVPATPASGLTSSQVQSILDVLASFDVDAATLASVKTILEGTTTGSVTSAAVKVFKANLTTGSLGSEVKMLQEFLNAHGYTVANSGAGSPGNETNTFGSLTRAALVKYQKAKGITPAVGYFGPLTRASINAEQ